MSLSTDTGVVLVSSTGEEAWVERVRMAVASTNSGRNGRVVALRTDDEEMII
jgi:hypothetical protein